jgi:hypothetical protein
MRVIASSFWFAGFENGIFKAVLVTEENLQPT